MKLSSISIINIFFYDFILDHWTDTTGSPDSDVGDEFLRLPNKLGPSNSPNRVRFKKQFC